MKIKDLDRNEVYGLEEIKKDAVKFDALKEWLEKNCHKWTEYKSTRLHIWDSLKYNLTFEMWYVLNGKPTKCALTLFDLDITDYQVDCSKLSDIEINKLTEIVKSNGHEIWKESQALHLTHVHKFLNYHNNHSSFGVFKNDLEKTTITYDKFIELFGVKKVKRKSYSERDSKENENVVYMETWNDSVWLQSDFGQYKLTEQGLVFHDDFDFELYKELGGLSKKPIEQAKPSQYQIGIDTFTRAESNMTKDEILACVRFNLDKYTWRKKDQDKEDFEKIISYAQWGLKQLKK